MNLLTLKFDKTFFVGGEQGYLNYADFPHFKQRAEWLYNYYVTNNLQGSVYILGVAYGYILKHLQKIIPPELINKFQGIEISVHAYNQCIRNGVDDQVTLIDATEFDWSSIPNIDLVISWNVLDCLPNKEKAEKLIKLLNANANRQIHLLSVIDDNHNSDNYLKEGYLIENRSFWVQFLTNTGTVLVDSDTGKVWLYTIRGWQEEKDWKIPQVWGQVTH